MGSRDTTATEQDTCEVLVLSDTHLAERVPSSTASWAAAVREANRRDPDLVVHAGDLSLDGIGRPDDLEWARQRLADLPGTWAAYQATTTSETLRGRRPSTRAGSTTGGD